MKKTITTLAANVNRLRCVCSRPGSIGPTLPDSFRQIPYPVRFLRMAAHPEVPVRHPLRPMDSIITLFFDTATTPANNNPLTAGWTQVTVGGTPVVGTNYNLAAGDMQGPAGSGTMLPDNWAAGQAGKFIIIGWSANLGSTWSTVSGELADTWNSIPGFNFANYYWFGVSAIGTATPTASPSPATQLWPLAGNTFVLEEVGPVVPEPGTMALTALGGASLLLFRSKK